MKRALSILVLLVILFFVFQWGIVRLKKDHEISYKVTSHDTTFEVDETYRKTNSDIYSILIRNDKQIYSYVFNNKYNKQKKIIKAIEYYTNGSDSCVYPILINNRGTNIQCIRDGKEYSGYSFPDQNFVNNIKNSLKEKGYVFNDNYDLTNTGILGSSLIYKDNLINEDYITLWNYKGIQIISDYDSDTRTVLSFDKYENNQGYLVGKYYVIPNYLSSRVLEFNTVSIIDIHTKKMTKVDLVYSLSSDTYINGTVDGKLYYTDPTNLLQIELNPAKAKSRLIGSADLGGQIYDGNWNNINIYDFVSKKILFQEKLPTELNKFSYQNIMFSNYSYYFYNNNGIYRVNKNNLDNAILLFKAQGINNFNVVNNTIYYVVDDTLYYYNDEKGQVPVVKNSDLRYNTINRIGINRKS